MKPAPFTYHRPNTVEDALSLLDRHGEAAKVLAGGQSLGPMMNMRLARPEHLVDLNDLIELDYLRRDGEVIEIGAMTRHHRLSRAPELRAALPLLAEAAGTIGHYAIRQRGTVAGSLVHADPAAQIPLVAVLMGAEVVIRSGRATRRVAAADFLQSIMTVDLGPDEIVTALRVPVRSPDTGWAFHLFSRRRGDFALASVGAVLGTGPDGLIGDLRLCLGSAGPVPLRLTAVEEAARGATPDAGWINATARDLARRLELDNTPQAPAAYRRDLFETLTARALAAARDRAEAA